MLCVILYEKKLHGEDCSCDKIDMETARAKMNHAIQGLKEAIQSHNSGSGTTIKSGDKTYVNCHKAHGKKLFVIIKYAVSLPGIGEEAQEIWRNLKKSYNVITRRDLIKISCILSRYAERAEDGLLVEHDRAMYSADLDFYRQSEMSVRDEIIDDFSTDKETIETLNSTSKAYGEATGARPKSGNQSGKPGHYTKETEDRKFKKELRRRNEQEAEEKRRKQKTEERLRHYQEWEINHMNEIGAMVEAIMIMTRTRAFELERKKAWSTRRSARRAAKHSRPRNREKINSG